MNLKLFKQSIKAEKTEATTKAKEKNRKQIIKQHLSSKISIITLTLIGPNIPIKRQSGDRLQNMTQLSAIVNGLTSKYNDTGKLKVINVQRYIM